jgi:hypothetical protein
VPITRWPSVYKLMFDVTPASTGKSESCFFPNSRGGCLLKVSERSNGQVLLVFRFSEARRLASNAFQSHAEMRNRIMTCHLRRRLTRRRAPPTVLVRLLRRQVPCQSRTNTLSSRIVLNPSLQVLSQPSSKVPLRTSHFLPKFNLHRNSSAIKRRNRIHP